MTFVYLVYAHDLVKGLLAADMAPLRINCSAQVRVRETISCLYRFLLSQFEGVDWIEEARLVGTATLLAGTV